MFANSKELWAIRDFYDGNSMCYLCVRVKESTHCTVWRLLAHAEVKILLNSKVTWLALPHGSQESGPGIGLLWLRCWLSCWLLNLCGVKELIKKSTNSDPTVNEQWEADPNRHHWSSLWAGDASVAIYWVAAVSSSCSYSLSLPRFQAEKRKRGVNFIWIWMLLRWYLKKKYI